MTQQLQKLTIKHVIDIVNIKYENINFSIDMFIEIYDRAELEIKREILIKFFDIEQPGPLDYNDFKIEVLPNYNRIISYNKQTLGIMNLFFEPSDHLKLPIIIQFKPL